jgi:hypothetical protein
VAEEKKRRDWLAVGISLFSLAISALTAFNAVLLKKDDVRFVVGDALRVMRDKNQFTLSETQELTFINSGNRQAVVSSIMGMLVLVAGPGSASAQCSQKMPLFKSIFLKADPLVLKPGEIQVVQAKVLSEYPWKNENGWMRFKEDGVVEGAANYVVCLDLFVTTPDSAAAEWIQPLYELPSKGDSSDSFDKKEPLKVLERTRIAF